MARSPSTEPQTTASIGPFAREDQRPSALTMSYAADNSGVKVRRARPMGELSAADKQAVALRRLAQERRRAMADPAAPAARLSPTLVTTQGSASVAQLPQPAADQVRTVNDFDRLSDPWLRGVALASDMQRAMLVTRMDDPDMRRLEPYLHKPDDVVAMTFSADPNLGMPTGQFAGRSVVFQATIAFAGSAAESQ